MSKESKREARRRLYEKRLATGRCVNCGSPKIVPAKIKCQRCLEIARRGSVAYANRMRAAALAAYGGPICVCCGETEEMFLTLDHINGGGRKHREEIKRANGSNSFYVWLAKNGYPAGFRVLCQNCNVGRWRNGGICPHQAKASTD